MNFEKVKNIISYFYIIGIIGILISIWLSGWYIVRGMASSFFIILLAYSLSLQLETIEKETKKKDENNKTK